jgi:hypothetical protein
MFVGVVLSDNKPRSSQPPNIAPDCVKTHGGVGCTIGIGCIIRSRRPTIRCTRLATSGFIEPFVAGGVGVKWKYRCQPASG